MSDLPPPSSQQVDEPSFFHHPDGQRIQVFVEAGGIIHRPRLIRKLKKHDVNICTDPKNAQIILVDASSWQGKEFIREWGKDQNKVVLNYAWVTVSENAGRPLLADDDWGGCLTQDDGLPIIKPTGMSDDKVIETMSLLPTPRETPVESDRRQSKKGKAPEVPSEKPPHLKHFPEIITTALAPIDSYEQPATQFPSQIQPSLLQQQQQQPQMPSMPSPCTTDAMSMFASNMLLGKRNGSMSSFNIGTNMFPLPSNLLSIFAQQQQQQQQPGVSPTMIPPSPSMMAQLQENFTTALMDAMRMQNPALGGVSTSQWPSFSGAASQQNSQILPESMAGSSTSGTIVREGSPVASLGRRDTESVDSSIISYRPPSSLKRKRKSTGSSYNSTDDDTGEDEVPLEKLAKMKASTPKQELEREERTARRTSLSFSAPGRNPHSKSSTSATSTGSLFLNEDGKPMQFYVQVDLKGRNEVLRAIKKNGGTLTVDIGIADYAVLWSKSTTFKELLSNASAAQTPAVTFHFILDIVSQGGMPENLENYLFDAKQDLKSRRRVKDPAAAERRRLMKNARRAERRAREREKEYDIVARPKVQEKYIPPVSSTPTIAMSPIKSLGRASKELEGPKRSAVTPIVQIQKPQTASTSKSTPASSSSPTKMVKNKPRYYPKEQTPPPPTKTQSHGSGGYLYTFDEKDWMEKYAFILFKRDPNLNRTEIANAFHKKLPHHTSRSIATMLSSAFDKQYTTAKKRGGIAHRKEKNKWEQEQQSGQHELEMAGEKEVKKKQGQQRIDLTMEDVNEPSGEQDVDHAMETIKEPPGEDNATISLVRDPMETDETAHPTADFAGLPEEEMSGPQLSPVEEEDIKVFLQVFASGDDPEQSEDQFFEKLGQVATCKSASTWREFNTRHEQQIMDRYSKQMMDITHGTEEH